METFCLTEDAANDAGEDAQARAEQADDPALVGFGYEEKNAKGEERVSFF